MLGRHTQPSRQQQPLLCSTVHGCPNHRPGSGADAGGRVPLPSTCRTAGRWTVNHRDDDIPAAAHWPLPRAEEVGSSPAVACPSPRWQRCAPCSPLPPYPPRAATLPQLYLRRWPITGVLCRPHPSSSVVVPADAAARPPLAAPLLGPQRRPAGNSGGTCVGAMR